MTSALLPNQLKAVSMAQWTPLRALLDIDEMQKLLQELPLFSLYQAGNLLPIGQGLLSSERFLEAYATYVTALKNHQTPPLHKLRHALCSFWSSEEDAVAVQAISDKEQVLSPALPLIQVQPHAFCYSAFDNSFRSMVFGAGSMTWGLQYSYPQVYQNPATHTIYKVAAEPKRANTVLFRSMQRWMRHHTLPLQFLAQEKKVCLPIRVSQGCLKWIGTHPQFHAWNVKLLPYQ